MKLCTRGWGGRTISPPNNQRTIELALHAAVSHARYSLVESTVHLTNSASPTGSAGCPAVTGQRW